MKTEQVLRDLDSMFNTSAPAVEPSGEARHRKPTGNGDQRTNED